LPPELLLEPQATVEPVVAPAAEPELLLDFDLDLAKAQNDENPAYYVQYAHARIASILRYAAERGLAPASGAAVVYSVPEERALIRKLAAFPEIVRGAAVAGR